MDKTASIIYLILTILSLIIPYIILTGRGLLVALLVQLDRMVSYRFSIISRVFEFYHLSWFGGINDFTLLNQKYNYNTIDNGYIRYLFGYGIIGMLVFQILFVLTVRRLLKESEYMYIICIFITAIWGLSENILINGSFNIAILFWSILFRKTWTKEGKCVINSSN